MVNRTGSTTLTIRPSTARSTRMLLVNSLFVVGLLVASACGIPVDDSTRDLAVNLPDALLPCLLYTSPSPRD